MASSSSNQNPGGGNKFLPPAKFGDKRPSEVKRTEYAVQMALKQDVDLLARKFLSDPDQPADFSLARFGRLFSQMELGTIFLGRFTKADLVEFSENLFHYIASAYMFNSTPIDQPLPAYILGPVNQQKRHQLFPTAGTQQTQQPQAEQQERTEQERIFGIFLIYCLYFVQPMQFVIPVYATAPQLAELHQFMAGVLLPAERFEALYCLYRLIQSNAFAVHAFEDSKFNPLLHRHFELLELGGTAATELDVRQLETLEDFAKLQGLASDPQLEQVQSIHQSYMEARLGNRVGLQPSSVLPTEGPQQLLERLLQETQSEMARTRFVDQFKPEQPREDGAGNSSADQLQPGEGGAESGHAHPKTVLSRRNKIRQMAYSTEFGSTRRDRRHRSVTAAATSDGDADEQSLMGTIKRQPVSPAATPSKGKKQQNRHSAKAATGGMEVKRETAEGEVGGEGGPSPGKKQPKRRRSRSRTLDRELDPAKEAILRQIEAEPVEGDAAGPSQQPTTSRQDTMALKQSIQQVLQEEEQTEQLWQRICAAGPSSSGGGAKKGKGKK